MRGEGGSARGDRHGADGGQHREGGAGPEGGSEAGGDACRGPEVAVGREDGAADCDREDGTEALCHELIPDALPISSGETALRTAVGTVGSAIEMPMPATSSATVSSIQLVLVSRARRPR